MRANEDYVKRIIHCHARDIGAGPFMSYWDLSRYPAMGRAGGWSKEAQRYPYVQRDLIALAISATHKVFRLLGLGPLPWEFPTKESAPSKSWYGRLQQVRLVSIFGRRRVLVDGAHNVDGARQLGHFVDESLRRNPTLSFRPRPTLRAQRRRPITWVVAMSDTRDAAEFFRPLLKSGDRVVTVQFGPVDGMPWVKPMDDEALLSTAKEVDPRIVGVASGDNLLKALYTAGHLTEVPNRVVVTGSLYLVGDLARLQEVMSASCSKATGGRVTESGAFVPCYRDYVAAWNQDLQRRKKQAGLIPDTPDLDADAKPSDDFTDRRLFVGDVDRANRQQLQRPSRPLLCQVRGLSARAPSRLRHEPAAGEDRTSPNPPIDRTYAPSPRA